MNEPHVAAADEQTAPLVRSHYREAMHRVSGSEVRSTDGRFTITRVGNCVSGQNWRVVDHQGAVTIEQLVDRYIDAFAWIAQQRKERP
jgi:hypothetical protein